MAKKEVGPKKMIKVTWGYQLGKEARSPSNSLLPNLTKISRPFLDNCVSFRDKRVSLMSQDPNFTFSLSINTNRLILPSKEATLTVWPFSPKTKLKITPQQSMSP
jgi:hypothetical protein